MNPFFDISLDDKQLNNKFQLQNLGEERISMVIGGRRGSEFWGTSSSPSKTFYSKTVPEDYDNLFVDMLRRWEPIYELDRLIEYHYQHYISKSAVSDDLFLKHMRFVILPKLKTKEKSETSVELFEAWLKQKNSINENSQQNQAINYNVQVNNNTGPLQIQQNSHYSTQTQHISYKKEDVTKAFELISKDIKDLDEKIRRDFSSEMEYAIRQMENDRDIKPQLVNMGHLIKDIGLNVFANLVASPIFELIRPLLGI